MSSPFRQLGQKQPKPLAPRGEVAKKDRIGWSSHSESTSPTNNNNSHLETTEEFQQRKVEQPTRANGLSNGYSSINGNNSTNGYSSINGYNSGSKSINNSRHVVNFSIEKRKRIELNSLEIKPTNNTVMEPLVLEVGATSPTSVSNSTSSRAVLFTESPRKGGQNSYQEYFDNLISLIDEAARELSV